MATRKSKNPSPNYIGGSKEEIDYLKYDDSLFDYTRSNVRRTQASVETIPTQKKTKSDRSLTRESTREKQKLRRQKQQEERRQEKVPAAPERENEEMGEYERLVKKRRAEKLALLEALKMNEIKDGFIVSIQALKSKMKRKPIKRPSHVGPVRRSARLQSKKRIASFEDENEEQYVPEAETSVNSKRRKLPADDLESSDSDETPFRRRPGAVRGMKQKMVIYSSDESDDEVPLKKHENDNGRLELMEVSAGISEDETIVELNKSTPEQQQQQTFQVQLNVNEDTGLVGENESSANENTVFPIIVRKRKWPLRPRDEFGRYTKNPNSQPRMRTTNKHCLNELEKLTSSKLLGACLSDSFLNCTKCIAKRTRSKSIL